MKYVKLIAKPETYFKPSTEVFVILTDGQYGRLVFSEWARIMAEDRGAQIECLGQRVAKGFEDTFLYGATEGQTFFVTQLALLTEFDVELVDEQMLCSFGIDELVGDLPSAEAL